jgi:DNA sulfur modification protein DndD
VHAVLNAVKGSASQAIHEHAQQQADTKKSLATAISTTKESEKYRRECDTKLKAAEQALAEQGNADEKRINQEILDLRPSITEYKELLKQMKLPTGEHSLKEAEDRHKKLERDLAKLTKTVELNNKIKVLRGILQDALEIADAALRKDVKDKCNERLAQVLKNDPLRIGSIEKSIALEGQGGASMGQTLAVGYTFLVTLLNEGNQSFPLVVDSPAGPLDHTIRREVARIIPTMSDQFLAFTISTEREGFVSTLADAVEEAGRDQVQFLTLVRLTAGTQPLVANAPPGRTVKTSNSALVDDREFFESFNLEAEEDEV